MDVIAQVPANTALTVGTGKSLHRVAVTGVAADPMASPGTACGAEYSNGRVARVRVVKGVPTCKRCARAVSQ